MNEANKIKFVYQLKSTEALFSHLYLETEEPHARFFPHRVFLFILAKGSFNF